MALASLSSAAGLPGGANLTRTPADQYIALLQSARIADRIIENFELQKLYDTQFKVKARKALNENVRISAGKKDGLISIEVDDTSPERAAQIANKYVDELRILAGSLALSEAQQRRIFFDRQLQTTRSKLSSAQVALERSGFDSQSLKTEPKTTAETFAKVKAAVVAAEVKLQTMRSTLASGSIELRQAETSLAALREQLTQIGNTSATQNERSNYVELYREFKYQEALFELFARQLELARADEAREGPLIQVIDPATPPELKSRPQRLKIALQTSLMALALISILTLAREYIPANNRSTA